MEQACQSAACDREVFERVWRRVMPEDRPDCPFVLPETPQPPVPAHPPALPALAAPAPAGGTAEDGAGLGARLQELLDGALAACMVVNHAYNEGYRSVAWGVEAADDELLVIHALGVRRACSGRGLAKAMARRVLQMARAQGLKTVRLDVLGSNLPAERAYTAVGFRHVDTLRMFYEDTGWTDYKAFEYLL